MRRSQSVRNQGKPSLMHENDDLGALKEDEENMLRNELLEKDRETDKLRTQIAQLKSQLADRPSLEAVQELKKEYTNLEILLGGTQRENERCMAELERSKKREKVLETQLAKLAGPNWQDNLDIGPLTTIAARGGLGPSHVRSNSIPKAFTDGIPADTEATKAYIEQVRLLVLGMEQRLQTREEKLSKSIEEAKAEGAKYEELKRQIVTAQ